MTRTLLLEDLYLGALLTLIVLIVVRNYRLSVWFYIAHSCLLGLIYVWYAWNMDNPMLYIWFGTTILSQAVIIPFAPGGLFYTIRKCNATETKPIIPLGPSIVFGIFCVLSLLGLAQAMKHIPIGTAYADDQPTEPTTTTECEMG